MSASTGKDTIYIDVDDDITGIIEKVRASKEKIVALVLPKRATVLQSIVNMKLLKHTTSTTHKRLVLITSEAGLLPLAGAVGLHVAKTLQSKPEIPEPPKKASDTLNADDDEDAEDHDVDKNKSIGELAGVGSAAAEDSIEIDNDSDNTPAGKKGKKSKKNKKLKVPNFESFRTRLFLAIGALFLLIFLWVLMTKVLPKAKITITTDSQSVDTSVAFNADTGAKSLDESKSILPATQKTYTKTDSEKVDATGQKDNGTKAGGTMTMSTICGPNVPTIPTGTNATAGGLTFVTQADVSLSSPSVVNGHCTFTGSVNVVAQQNGDKYNLAARTDYVIAGYSAVSGSGSDMTGGTSVIAKVVSQADVDGAKQKILDRNNQTARDELNKQMQNDNLFAINDTFAVGTPSITPTPNVGDEASQVTVNMTVSYTMLGVKKDDLKTIVEDEIKKHIDSSKQSILDNGIGSAQTTVTDKKSDTNVKVSLTTTAEAGAQVDGDAIKKAIAGKKRGDTQDTIEGRPGIKDVKIEYSPFWVGGTPSRTSHIKVIFLQPNGQPSKQ